MKYTILISMLLLIYPAQAGPLSDIDDYATVNATINGQPVLFAIDTGSEVSCLFSPTVTRLGLEVTDPPIDYVPSPGKVSVKLTEECKFTIEGLDGEINTRFPVIGLTDEADNTSLGGLVGWAQLKNTIMWIDADVKRISTLKKLPENIDTWSKWTIHEDPKFSVLMIKVPNPAGDDGIILIDTGSPKGVSLSSRSLKEWSIKQNGTPYTLMALYTPAVGLKVYREYWAEGRLPLGDFAISDIPVYESNAVFEQVIKGLIADFGMFVLTRLEVIIDGPGGYFYTRSKKNPTSQYKYNRAGAVFVPQSPQSISLTAHVVKDGPAYKAGVRDGDILTKIDDLDVTKWRTDPNVLPMSRFWEKPAGTKLLLSLLRGDKPFTATVELQNIFPQNQKKRGD